MLELSPNAEAVLFAIVDEYSHSFPNDWIELPPLANRCHVTLAQCKGAATELDHVGLAKLIKVVPGRTLVDTIQLTQSGRDAIHDLSVVTAHGSVAEFASELDDFSLRVLDAVVEAELRNAGGAATRSHVRTIVRKVVLPKPTIEDANRIIDALVGPRLEALGGAEPSYHVTLRGLLGSRWGTDALQIIHGALGFLRDLKVKDPSLFRYSWGTFRNACRLPPRARNLAYIAIANAKLGNGFFESEGDYWWATPPELDILVENETALMYAQSIVPPIRPAATEATALSSQSEAAHKHAENSGQFVSHLEQLLEPDVSPVVRSQRAFELLDLHPLIRTASQDVFRNGHYREAVFNATVALIDYTKRKAVQVHLDGKPLMLKVFSREKPLLTFNTGESQTDKDEQEGLMHLFAGLTQGIRNPRAHGMQPDTHDVALECIVFCSFLAKKLDQAELRCGSA